MRRIQGKRSLVTGAAGGIGRAIAMRLAREGARLALLDRDAATLRSIDIGALGAKSEPLLVPCDLCDDEEIAAAVNRITAEWGGLDILVNNAGVVYHGKMTQMTQVEWQQVLAVNLWGPAELTRLLLPHLLAQPEAHIVNVCSMFGYFVTNRCTAYHLTKFGLLGFSEALRAECARSNLGVTALCPGFVKTGLFASMAREGQLVSGPPSWICTTAEKVANQAVRAIYRNRRMAMTGWLARLAYLIRRIAPWLFDALYHVGRLRWLKKH